MSQARIVALAPNWLGDAVMALPALAGVRAAYPSAHLLVAARPGIAPLFAMVPGVDAVVRLEDGGWSGFARWNEDARALAAADADTALLFPNSFRSAWVARRAGIAERWGFAADFRSRLLTRPVARLRGRHHMTEYYAALVRGLGIDASPQPPRVVVPDAALGAAASLLAELGVGDEVPLVGMAPGAAYGRAKQWPPERFAQLAMELHARLGAVSIIVGAKGDGSTAQAITREVARIGSEALRACAVLDLAGRTDLPTLAAVMQRCRAFVSNDSGAMHFAAAVGVPVVAIFGSTDERGTAPMPSPRPGAPAHEILATSVWCRPCMLRECPIDHRCMTGIDARRVADAVQRLAHAA